MAAEVPEKQPAWVASLIGQVVQSVQTENRKVINELHQKSKEHDEKLKTHDDQLKDHAEKIAKLEAGVNRSDEPAEEA